MCFEEKRKKNFNLSCIQFNLECDFISFFFSSLLIRASEPGVIVNKAILSQTKMRCNTLRNKYCWIVSISSSKGILLPKTMLRQNPGSGYRLSEMKIRDSGVSIPWQPCLNLYWIKSRTTRAVYEIHHPRNVYSFKWKREKYLFRRKSRTVKMNSVF